MFIPLGTDRPLRRPTLTTYLLIGVSIAAYIVQLTTRPGGIGGLDTGTTGGQPPVGDFTLWGMLWPPGTAVHDGVGFHWWQFITYQFLHAEENWWHIAGNMLILYVFGPNLEDRLGRLWFLLFYLLGGVAAGALQLTFSRHPLIGASGAIAACTGAYLVMFPRTQVKAIFLLALGSIVNISAWWFITFSICMDIGSQLFGRARLPFGGSDNVAHLAHLGGYFYGAAIAFSLLGLKLIPREQYDLFSMGKQAYRRRQFKEAGRAAQQKVAQHWDKAKQAQGEADALAAARADVIAKINASDLPAAAAAYKKLADTYANYIGGTTLSRRYQYDIANYFYTTKDHTAALYAYERFLEAYPKDPESPSIKLLLGLLHARTFNDPIRAKQLISDSIKDLDDSSAAIARKELEALG
jgi:membrane associated rhomboid family serine protease